MSGSDKDGPRAGKEDGDARFGTILEHAPVMVDSFDADGTCTIWNRECERRLGWTIEEINALEQPLSVFYPDPEMFRRVLADVERCDGSFREYQVVAKDRSVRIQLWANFKLPGGAMISVGHDVTEQRAVEAQLRHAQKMEAIGQLTGGIAHDFNNLLTVILASAELLTGEERWGDVQELATQIRQAATDGAGLVRQLMTFARQRRLVLAPCDVDEVVDKWLPNLRRIFPDSIEIHVDGSPGSTTVLADRSALEQILLNLSTNARDAIEQVQSRGRITIATRIAHRRRSDVEHAYVVLSVRDTGPGMSSAVREKVLEPFFTTKPVGRGTGLGLPIVFGLVEGHHGFLEIFSEPGSGTLIEIWLPRTLEGGAPEELEGAQTSMPMGTGETILLVEDDAAAQRTTRRALERLGYRVLTASDGFEALVTLDGADSVDLVISDVVMPRMTGPELLERLRARGAPLPPFTFSTGYVSGEGDQRMDPSVPRLDKPWSLRALAVFVRAQLEGQRS